MKRTLFLTAVAAILAFAGCDKTADPEYNSPVTINEPAVEALLAMYPDAIDITWTSKGDYLVATFSHPTTRSSYASHTAWFSSAGKWYMTETDITFSDLPEAVQAAFLASEYASWRIDDVDKIERSGAETVYVIEVEGTQNGVEIEYDLYYTEDGTLVKTVADAEDDYDYEDYIPSETSSTSDILSYIEANYPSARILEIDYENGMTEVEILYNGVCYELLFDATNAWVYTKTELNYVPEIVQTTLAASAYASYRIDDIDFYQTASDGDFYKVELESAQGDVEVKITLDGVLTVLSGYGAGTGSDSNTGNENNTGSDSNTGNSGDTGNSGNTGNSSMLSETVTSFIYAKYPGATIREYEWDDGYLEVEIYHNSREKDVYFNGAEEWVRTKWDIRKSELPTAVTAAIAASQYANYTIDDIEYIETPTVEYYEIELERGNSEVTLRITADGTVL